MVSVIEAAGPSPARLLANTEKVCIWQFKDVSSLNIIDVVEVLPDKLKESPVIDGKYITSTSSRRLPGATQLNKSSVRFSGLAVNMRLVGESGAPICCKYRQGIKIREHQLCINYCS